MSDEAEEWRAVVGLEGRYEVSNLGRIRSLDRITISNRNGKDVPYKIKGKLMKPALNGGGYYGLLMDQKPYNVHVVVAEAFIGPRPDKMVVCHWDDNKNNNKLSNLRYGTRDDNTADAIRNKIIPCKGYNKGGSRTKLTKEQCEYIKSHEYKHGLWTRLGRELGVHDSTVRDVWHGITFNSESSPWRL